MLQRAASNAYSWWWASHIRTNQSKWLDGNLQEMEEKVKQMLKIIDQEADSFGKRAEMYYKKRPELMNHVEETYKAYRALAERYDRISGELHKANHTIATAFPDQVPFEIQDEDDDGLPKAFTSIDPSKMQKSPSEIPKIKSSKKERHGKSSLRKMKHSKVASHISKEKAHKEIDRLQKVILVLQTEKEFIKSSYDNGLAKFWDIERQISEMQDEVCFLQDQFGTSSVIEDDEARALIAAAALKSCEDTLVSLQEKQNKSAEEARTESERIRNAKEKLKALKGEQGPPLTVTGEMPDESTGLQEPVYMLKPERLELQTMCEKVKEHFEMNSESYVAELAEKIDNFVDKVISLELTVSSQTAEIIKLRFETDELQKYLQSLEEEKLSLSDGSQSLSKRLKQAEKKLQRVQDLEKCVKDEKYIVHAHFTEACHNLNDLSVELQSPECQDQHTTASPSRGGEGSDLNNEPHKKGDEKEVAELQDTTEAGVLLEIGSEAYGGTLDPKCQDWHLVAGPSQEGKSSHLNNETDKEGGVKEVPGPQGKREVGALLQNGSGTLEGTTGICTEGNGILPKPESQMENDQEKSQIIEKDVPFVHDMKGNFPEELVQSQTNPQVEIGSRNLNNLKKEAGREDKFSSQEEYNTHLSNEYEHSTHLSHEYEAQDGGLNLQQLLEDGLEGREQILLNEYTSTLRNYKEVKKKLSEVQKKNQDSLSDIIAQLRDLKSSNAMKDEEIRLLRQNLNLLQESSNENKDAGAVKARNTFLSKLDSMSHFSKIRKKSSKRKNSERADDLNADQKKAARATHEVESKTCLPIEANNLYNIEEPPPASAIEEKFRRDIDGVLEENLEFWLRFSTTFHRVQKLQAKFDDLQIDMEKTKDSSSRSSDASRDSSSDQSLMSVSAPMDKQLRELKTEFQVWLEQNGMLKGELKQRFSTLCGIQDEIVRVLKENSEGGEVQFTPYQAAKFQGEVLNMQQENNKVSNELQAGLDHVRGLQVEVEKALLKLQERFEISGSRSSCSSQHNRPLRNTSNKNKIPLRSFLYGVKPKKPSIFSCMNPALQKQYNDMQAALPR